MHQGSQLLKSLPWLPSLTVIGQRSPLYCLPRYLIFANLATVHCMLLGGGDRPGGLQDMSGNTEAGKRRGYIIVHDKTGVMQDRRPPYHVNT